ncbi:type 1 glutamine amidotransferase [Leucobacter edaphi]|uniref:type 1 glutamine amidotransferase n=1 Tax=Leucobacter edaphi TaxID=2796472 RepID=UPI001F23E9FF|nr:type 1 glutamine amidotransferase [Leucobacter edaphi]
MVARVLVVQHDPDAGLNYFADRLLAAGVTPDVVGPAAAAPVPTKLDGYAGVVVLGGAMGPSDDETAPWLPATRELLRTAVESEIPTLGVCLGSQLLTVALGGEVRENPAGPEIGLSEISIETEAARKDPLFAELSGLRVPAVQWHWLESIQLPAGATPLASSPGCGIQAYRVGEAAWGVQFHPEALSGTVSGWGEGDPGSLAAVSKSSEQVTAEVRASDGALETTWGGLATRFARLVAAQEAEARPELIASSAQSGE